MSILFIRPIPKASWLLLLFLSILSPMLQAQDLERSNRFQFSCVTWDQLSLPELFYREGRKYMPLELFTGKRSALYKLRKTMALELYIQADDDDGKKIYKLVGQAPLPVDTKRGLFFIKETGLGDGLPLTVSGVDDSLKAFPPGSFRFVNVTNVPLQVDFGDNTSALAPRGMTLMELDFSKHVSLLPFYIKMEDGQVIYENRLFAQSDGREMVFIAPPNKRKNRLTIKFLSDTVRSAVSTGNNANGITDVR